MKINKNILLIEYAWNKYFHKNLSKTKNKMYI